MVETKRKIKPESPEEPHDHRTATGTWEKRREKIRGSAFGPALLKILSLIFWCALLLRKAIYQLGLKKPLRLPARVISIGNLSVGGTGKTPAAILAAETLHLHGKSLAILSRGYNRLRDASEVVTLLDDNPPHWEECGDEPWMMHQALFGLNIPILVSKNRVRAGQEAITFYHSKALILDDGFQHWKIKRDLDIVLVNAAAPFTADHLLPSGNLREPASSLKRAHLVVITHADLISTEDLKVLREKIEEKNSRAEIIEAVHAPDFLLDLKSQRRLDVSLLEGRRIVTLSGIAYPQLFENQLKDLGAKIEQRWRYPDHHPYQIEELKALETMRAGRALITTLKDATRLPLGWKETFSGEFYALAIKLKITQGQEIWEKALLG